VITLSPGANDRYYLCRLLDNAPGAESALLMVADLNHTEFAVAGTVESRNSRFPKGREPLSGYQALLVWRETDEGGGNADKKCTRNIELGKCVSGDSTVYDSR
jgi:hypothetical protein